MSDILGQIKGFGFLGLEASKFADVWNHFDQDKSGFIEDKEIDSFVKELGAKILQKEPTEEEIAKLKDVILSSYDNEKDGKLSIVELAQMLLPNEQVFLLLFRRTVPLQSSVKFMEIWKKYDANCSGYLTVHELENFVADFVTQSGELVEATKIKEYAASIMELFDKNEDGLLDLTDMAQLLNARNNFLLTFKMEDSSKEERRRDFEKIFSYYDLSGSGALEDSEIDGFVKDMMETTRKSVNAIELEQFKAAVLRHCDTNKDGKIQKKELALVLCVRL